MAHIRRSCQRFSQRKLVLGAALWYAGFAVAPSLSAAAKRSPVSSPGAPQGGHAKLTREQRTLHALDRLTFGPRPGEVDAVTRQGLDKWFQQQLHPERIPDDALQVRLAQYPAMQLSQAQLVAAFPTPQMLRQYADGKLEPPADPVEKKIYEDASFVRQEKRDAKAARAAGAAGDAQSSSSGASGSPAPLLPTAPPTHGMSAKVEQEETLPTGDSLLSLPPAARFARLVALTPEQMQDFRLALKGPEQGRLVAGMSPGDVERAEAMRSPEKVISAEVLSTRLLRDVYSQRQLQAVMADFWLNHFSVYLRKNQNEPYLLPAYERDAILPHALGHFEDLLVATAKSPAMLVYLDNWQSLGPHSVAAERASRRALAQANLQTAAAATTAAPKGINENYARELMELHTLGVNGGYTQADVVEVAKCFSGWTIDRPAQGGEFFFDQNRHEPGPKTVLGHTLPQGGMDEGLMVLHLLATSPATAHFVSLKLAQRFVSDTPSAVLLQRMAATFLKSDGDIAAVLSTMFHSPEFWSPAVQRAKVKTPLEFLTSALRATDAEVVNPVPLVQALDRLGMPLYGRQTPDGYPAVAEDWVSSNALLTRMNFALVLGGNRLPGTRLDWPALLAQAPEPDRGPPIDEASSFGPPSEIRLEELLLGRPAAPQTRTAALQAADTPGLQQQAVESFRATSASTGRGKARAEEGNLTRVKAKGREVLLRGTDTPLGTAGGLLLGSPDFQRR